jgi:hypothetical protein
LMVFLLLPQPVIRGLRRLVRALRGLASPGAERREEYRGAR